MGLKDAIYRTTAEEGLAMVGEGRGNRSDVERATQKRVKAELIPALLLAMEPKSRSGDDVVSAAYIALAKVTDDPAHVERILAVVTKSDVSQLVRESCALAAGLLRRQDADRRFDAKELDRVREACLAWFDDESLATRTRAFALFSLALLGDQPTGRGVVVTEGATPAGESLADRLFERLHREWQAPDLPAGLMLALSMQPATTIRPEMRQALVSIALRQRLGKVSFDGIVSSYAALALGRIGNADDARPLLDMLTIRTVPVFVKRSAAVALGQLGEHAAGPDRATVVTGLWKAYDASRDVTVRSFALMSVARILAAEAREGRTDALDAKGVRHRRRAAEGGRRRQLRGPAVRRPGAGPRGAGHRGAPRRAGARRAPEPHPRRRPEGLRRGPRRPAEPRRVGRGPGPDEGRPVDRAAHRGRVGPRRRPRAARLRRPGGRHDRRPRAHRHRGDPQRPARALLRGAAPAVRDGPRPAGQRRARWTSCCGSSPRRRASS